MLENQLTWSISKYTGPVIGAPVRREAALQGGAQSHIEKKFIVKKLGRKIVHRKI